MSSLIVILSWKMKQLYGKRKEKKGPAHSVYNHSYPLGIEISPISPTQSIKENSNEERKKKE
jgi:hypothetical protein